MQQKLFTEVFIDLPLYKSLDLNQVDLDEVTSYIEGLKNPSETLDVYCIECKRQSTFSGSPIKLVGSAEEESWNDGEIFGTEFRCSRESKHKMQFIFRWSNGYLTKFGQYPSLADLHISEIKEYRKVLSSDKFNELAKGIGLFAHGIGIGAYVYLRRIFEDLLELAHMEASKEDGWDENQYQRSRVDEKIQILSPHLPRFLLENKQLYSILSKGIHSLNEDECLQYFTIVKVGIELILDEKLDSQKRQQKISRVSKEINELHQKLQETGNGN